MNTPPEAEKTTNPDSLEFAIEQAKALAAHLDLKPDVLVKKAIKKWHSQQAANSSKT